MSSMNNSNSNSGFGNFCGKFKEDMNRFLDKIPCFVKLFLFISFILFFLNLFIPYVSLFLSNYPFLTFLRFQIWRLWTTVFITSHLLSLIFGFIFWVRDGSQKELRLGTVQYMLEFFMHSIIIEVLYSVVMLLIFVIVKNSSLVFPQNSMNFMGGGGIWPMVMCEITIRCLQNPDAPTRLWCFPCIFKAKYYPLVLFGFFTLMSGFVIDIENLCAIGYGFLYYYVLSKKLQIPLRWIKKLETSRCLKWMTKMKGFIYNSSASDVEVWSPNPLNNLENNMQNNLENHRSSGFKAFKGKGYTVGESSAEELARKSTSSEMSINESSIDNENNNNNNDKNNGNDDSEIDAPSCQSLDTSSTNSSIGLNVKIIESNGGSDSK